MVKIKCLVCESVIKFPDFIDTNDYDGQLICQKCRSLLHVKLVKAKLQKYDIVKEKFLPIKTIIVHYPETEEVKEK